MLNKFLKSKFALLVVGILIFASFIYADDYYYTAPNSSPGAIFMNSTLAYNCSYTNFSYLWINFSGYLLNFSGVVGNLSIYTYNATGGIFNITNVTSPYVGGAIKVLTPDGIYNISMNLSNVTFSKFNLVSYTSLFVTSSGKVFRMF